MLKTTMTVQLRCFDVLVEDQRTRETKEDAIVFTLDQLHAAQIVGQSSKELIMRAFGRQGYKVLDNWPGGAPGGHSAPGRAFLGGG